MQIKETDILQFIQQNESRLNDLQISPEYFRDHWYAIFEDLRWAAGRWMMNIYQNKNEQ